MILEGKKYAELINNETKEILKELNEKSIYPCLAVVVVGNDHASAVYVRNKKRVLDNLGISNMDVVLPENISKEELEKKLNELSNNKVVTSILLQLPLPEHLKEDTNEIMSHICSEKDVDGFTAENIGNLDLYKNVIAPCTPAGIIKMLKYENVEIDGKHVVIVGRSNIVGKPLAKLFLRENATVTICHSYTKDLRKFTSDADILIAAVGKANFITADMVKEDSIVIDVGINRVNGKLVGDVDFEHVKEKVEMITPVPGGVGKITTAMLAYNVVRYI